MTACGDLRGLSKRSRASGDDHEESVEWRNEWGKER
jgi:hypothetical protein